MTISSGSIGLGSAACSCSGSPALRSPAFHTQSRPQLPTPHKVLQFIMAGRPVPLRLLTFPSFCFRRLQNCNSLIRQPRLCPPPHRLPKARRNSPRMTPAERLRFRGTRWYAMLGCCICCSDGNGGNRADGGRDDDGLPSRSQLTAPRTSIVPPMLQMPEY